VPALPPVPDFPEAPDVPPPPPLPADPAQPAFAPEPPPDDSLSEEQAPRAAAARVINPRSPLHGNEGITPLADKTREPGGATANGRAGLVTRIGSQRPQTTWQLPFRHAVLAQLPSGHACRTPPAGSPNRRCT